MNSRARLLAFCLLALLLPSIALAQAPLSPSTLHIQARGNPCNQGGNAAPPNLSALLAKPVVAAHGSSAKAQPADAYNTGFNYLLEFYPRWFTYWQALGPCNRLVAPDRISPLYHTVVAINDDTLYASAFAGVQTEPVIVTVPATPDNYSVLQLDQYGNVFSGIPNNQPGIYALTLPGWQGSLPPNVIQVTVPYAYTELIFRADKYVYDQQTMQWQDMRAEADKFRRALHCASLTDYLNDPNSGPTAILPELIFAVPYKGIAVYLIANQPITFLQTLQTALLATTTQPLSADEQVLSDTFNQLLSDQSNWPQLALGAQAAHDLVTANYLTHTFMNTSWVEFTNIGAWDMTFQGYLDRSSVTDYIQYGNNHDAAVYYHSFSDANGKPLDGTKSAYVLTFPPGGQPDVSRFWSLTAYLPIGIELVPNPLNKYVVASYTPGLVTNPDGSVTVVMSVGQPQNSATANWLPIPSGAFSILLRAYGPQGSVLNNTYVPPPIEAIPATLR